jgi:hypothetical protein
VVTLVVMFFGYSQWRRQAILRMCDGLYEDGYSFDTPDDFRDMIWQRKPYLGQVKSSGRILALMNTPDGISPGLLSEEEATRLIRLGVADYSIKTSELLGNE